MARTELAGLIEAIESQTTADGTYETDLKPLTLSRFSAPTDLVALIYEPSLCLVLRPG